MKWEQSLILNQFNNKDLIGGPAGLRFDPKRPCDYAFTVFSKFTSTFISGPKVHEWSSFLRLYRQNNLVLRRTKTNSSDLTHTQYNIHMCVC